jgi:arylsulfatase A-like enzyme
MATVHVMHGRSDPLSFFGSTRDPVAPPKYLVLMVLDGARPDYFGLTPLRHVDALRAQGTQYTNAFDGILESETPAGHSTIATGSTPARNGILGFEWAQSDNDYSLFDPNVVRSGAMEHIMEQEGVPTIASLYKARYPKARVVALSGHKYYAADPLGGPAADAIMYYQGDPQGRYVPVSIPGHSPPAGVLNAPGVIAPNTRLADGAEDSLATKLALAAFAKMHQRITLINYPEFDWPVGHVDGGNQDPAKVIQLMKAFDRDLGKIEDAYSKAGVLKQTLFVITADHGMAPLKRFIPSSIISDAVQQAGTTAPAVSNSTGAYVWLADTSKAQLVAQNIVKAADPSIQSVYYLTTSGGQTQYALAGGSFVRSEVDKTNQYLLGTLVNGHEPTVVVFAKENASFADPSTNWKADHGGASWQSQHIPLILAGPGIRPAVVTGQPAQLDDLAPTILTDMGAKTTGMQGNVLTDALLSSKVQVQRVRSAEVKLLTPMVNAMIAQDNYESSAR